ncbi:26S proteasome non-ATPase regulatory subunit 5 [Episyrphus balteatus]|uniref:26S proteasome non-ATPase regulatory subunit 5 n=1 Tax=Episyrphus balteatus TaxID=286459 RepID=UPI002485F23C|nr:26S proteasome non-ATPase regulatory subunit 5 [Episyrphus balteatus]
MGEDWCLEKLENLRIKENRVETLNEIRSHLNIAQSLENIVTEKLLKSSEIYDCLEEQDNSNNASVQSDLAIDILSICMSHLTINQTDLPNLLERSLQHNNPKVRALALNTILKELAKHSNATVAEDLIQVIINCIAEHETSVGAPSVEILSILLADKINKRQFKEALLSKLNQSDDIVRCRIYEVAINLSKISPAHLSEVEEILHSAVETLENNDILLQVNVLEILASLAGQNHGLVFLEQKRVFEKISKRVDEIEQNPLDRLLVPGIMKFFGKIAYNQPQKIITGYPNMILCLFDCIHSADPMILPTAFDTLGNLAHSQQGKLLLEANYSSYLRQTFEDFFSYLRNLPTELKNRAFNALEIVFSCEGEASQDVSKVLQKWYQILAGGENLQFLMDFCRNPFPDIKVACLNFIRALCRYRWGIVALKYTAGFVEYLLDRKVEFDKDAKYAKFEIIEILSESNVFDVQTQLQLKKYVNEGPYFVQPIVEIAVEGS